MRTGNPNPNAGKGAGRTKWARFGEVPTGWKTTRVTIKPGGQNPKLGPHQKLVRVGRDYAIIKTLQYRQGGWIKVGSAEYKRIVSVVGASGHQAAIPKEYKVGKINPALRVVGSPDSVDRNAYIKQQNKLVAAGLSKPAAQKQLGKPPPGINDVRPGSGPTDPKNPAKPPTTHNTNVLSKGIGSTNVGRFTPMKDAVAQANLQFGAQIKDTRLAQAEGDAQHAQNLHDIQQWYKQIGDVNAAAQTANQGAVNQEVQGDQGNMLAALRAIGGSANASSGAVAAAGLNDQGLARGLGQSQDAFSNLIQGALGGAQAGQMSAQSALDSQAARSLQQQLSDLQGQRGDAIVTNQDAIRAANNELAQTRFGDRISKQQAIQAGVALAGSQRLQAQQITGQALSNTIAGQQAGIYPTTGNNGNPSQANHTAWAAMKPADRYGAVTSAIKALGGIGGGATPHKVAIMLSSMGGWAPVHTTQFINTFFQ